MRTMSFLEIVYIACFVFGLGYALFSSAFGGGHEGSGDIGLDAAHDVTAHVDTTPDPSAGSIHFSPFSPAVIAMFVTAFGATGMICLKVFHFSTVGSLTVAVLAGLAVAAITFYIFVALFSKPRAAANRRSHKWLARKRKSSRPYPPKV